MTEPLQAFAWAPEQIGDALDALAQNAGLPARNVNLPEVPADLVQPGGLAVDRWVAAAASWMGLEAEPVETTYAQLDGLLEGAGPALVRLFGGAPRFLALAGRRRRRLLLLGPGGERGWVPSSVVRRAICEVIEAPFEPVLARVLHRTGTPQARLDAARTSILRERFGGRVIRGFWILRRRGGAPLSSQLRAAGLLQRLTVFAVAHLAEYFLFLLSWWLVGRGALQGRIDPGWLLGWGLVLLSLAPFRAVALLAAGRAAIEGGAVLKQRLLVGAAALDPERIRSQGAGQLLGRVLESEAVEQLALGGGTSAVMAAVDLLVALFVLVSSAPSFTLLGALCGWGVVAVVLGAVYASRRKVWTEVRVEMTHDLVERLVGHRTRLTQEPRARWHEDEDRALEGYLSASRSLDRSQVMLTSLVPRAWLLLGTVGLFPLLVDVSAAPARVAVAAGAVLLSFRALRTLVNGVMDIVGAGVAWRQVRPLMAAADTFAPVQPAAFPVVSREEMPVPLLSAHQLAFRYPEREGAVLRGVDLTVQRGDRVLLEGPSGSGKSTLLALLSGHREPGQGLLLLDGLDRPTLGLEGWRQRVASAPQFHDNHLVGASLAFNLLMGRRWPTRPGDLEEAEAICRELDLGPLIDRMPSGMMQVVGETGWQLSHGERSRLFIARALLQDAELVVLDESFAALDPETLARTYACVRKRSRSLVVIAHP